MANNSLPAVVLAAGREADPVTRHFGLPHKALMPIAGQPTINWVVQALLEAERVGPVVVVTETEEVRAALPATVARVAPEGTGFVDSIAAGVAHFPQAERVLLCTCDLPLLTAAAVDDFIARALDTNAELCYSIVRASRLEELPGRQHRTVIRLREGRFTGGNLAYLGKAFVEREGARLTRAFAGRKNPIKLAALFGLYFIWRLLWGRLSLAEILAKAESLLGVPVAVVDSHHVEICIDLDKPEHVEIAEEMLARRR